MSLFNPAAGNLERKAGLNKVCMMNIPSENTFMFRGIWFFEATEKQIYSIIPAGLFLGFQNDLNDYTVCVTRSP